MIGLCPIVTTTGCGGGQTVTGEKYSVGMVTDVGGLMTKLKKDIQADVKALESKREEDYIPNLTRFAREGRRSYLGYWL